MLEIQNAVVKIVLIFLNHNGLHGWAKSSSLALAGSYKVIHDKIILKACFDSSVETMFIQSS